MDKGYKSRSEKNKSKKTKNRKTKKTKSKVIISIVVILLLIVGIGWFAVYKFYSKANNVKITENKDELNISKDTDKLANDKKIKNILLIGSDEGTTDENGRSDSMMVLTIDKGRNKLKVTSFLRDTLVEVPGHDKQNLNYAYAYGNLEKKGPELLIKTLNSNFDLNIDDYVKVDFGSFVNVVDKMGGVEIDINRDEIDVTNEYIESINKFLKKSSPTVKKSGVQNLNGVQTLAYSRDRYVGQGDFSRTDRQRKVLQAVFNKINKNGIMSAVNTASDVMPYVTTTLSIGEIGDIATWMSLNKIGSFEQGQYPARGQGENVTKNGEYHLVVDLPTMKDMVYKYIFLDEK